MTHSPPITILKLCRWGFLAFFLMGELYAQVPKNLIFHHYSLNEGLSSGKIRRFLQDKEGFIWIATQQGLNRFDGKKFQRFYFDPRDTLSLSSNVLKGLAEDDSDRIWIGTKNAGLVYFDKKKETFHRLIKGPLDENLTINYLFWGREGILWIGTDEDELYGYNPATDSLITYTVTGNPQTGLSGGGIMDIWESPEGKLFVACERGINVLDPTTRTFTYFFHEDLPEDPLRSIHLCIHPDDSATFWLGTHNGITHWDPQNQTYTRYYPQGDSLPHVHNIINDLWELNERFLWVASRKGLLLFDKISKEFQHLSDNSTNLYGLRDSPYNVLFEDRSGLLWIGGNDGVYTWDKYSLNFYKAYSSLSKPSQIHRRMTFQGDRLWMATEHGIFYSLPDSPPQPVLRGNFYSVVQGHTGHIYAGPWGDSRLFKIDPQSLAYEVLPLPWEKMQAGASLTFLDIIHGTEGILWLVTRSSLFRFEEEGQNFFEIPNSSSLPWGFTGENNNDLLWDQHGNLWIASDRGLFLLAPQEQMKSHPDSMRFIHFTYDPTDSTALSTNEINTLYEDSQGRIWIGSKSGLMHYDPAEGIFSHHRETETLAHGYITCMLEDSLGNLWIATDNSGITQLHLDSGEIRTYLEEDGLLSTSFNWNSCTCTPDKGFVFASREGLNHFYPEDLSNPTKDKPTIYLTELWIQNERVLVDHPDSILPHSLIHTSGITLKHYQKGLRLQFSLLDYDAPTNNNYRYILENFDKDWQVVGNVNEATYTNLGPGAYTFRVQGRNSRGEFSELIEDRLFIRILPPWWWNIYAWLIYLALGLLLIWGIYKNQLTLRLRKAEAEKVLEIDRIRNQLYTDITHEIRTPLTVINGMIELLNEQYRDVPGIQEHVQVVGYNTQKILDLINQILDLARLEEGGMPLNLKQGNIIPYLGYITESFHSYALTQEISLTFTPEGEEILLDFDADKVLTVLSNLLSNALKYTPKYGLINVKVSREQAQTLLISVKDSGVGIDADRIPFIFDRYYQAANSLSSDAGGTGIGLALTQELVHLMRGKIWVQSVVGEGSTFYVELPITQFAPIMAYEELIPRDNLYHKSLTTSAPQQNIALHEGVNTPEDLRVLVIEDSANVRFFLQKLLSPSFRVDFAENGKLGVEKAIQSIPDIIISDVMMPEMNGMELCKFLKQDERTSHIPIILLTAKVDQMSKNEGLAYGADAYLGKPLDKEELLTRMVNLVELRNTLRQKFEYIPQNTHITPENPDEEFLQKVGKAIEDSLDDPNLGVEDICKKVGVSRTQLHRKLTALTGLAPSHTIRKVRMKKARQMLIHTKAPIAQIASDVGITDPSYFSKVYLKEFKEKPSATRLSLKKPG